MVHSLLSPQVREMREKSRKGTFALLFPILLSGALMMIMLEFAAYIGERSLDRNYYLIRMGKTIQRLVSLSHLRLEEELIDKNTINHEQDVMRPIEKASDLVHSSLDAQQWVQNPPSGLLGTLKGLDAKLKEFLEVTVIRESDGTDEMAGSGLEQKLDSIHGDILRLCESLSTIEPYRHAQNWIFRATTGLAGAIFGLLGILLFRSRRTIQRYNRELESLVKSRTEQLRNANCELSRARDLAKTKSQAKGEFLAYMSHEIRNPVNGIIGLIDLLRGTRLGGEQLKYVQTLQGASKSLLYLLNDILDLSRIEEGKIDLTREEFDLEELVEGVIEFHAIAASRKGLEMTSWIDPALPTRLRGDPERLRQIFNNLIGNAVKFTDRGGVSVKVRSEPRLERKDGIWIRFEVIDSGAGVPGDQLESLLQPFTRGSGSVSRKQGGTGLGLAISNRLAEMMDGAIEIETIPNASTTFSAVVRLEAPLSSPVPPPRGGLDSLSILIVDPNPASRGELKSLLESWGALVEGSGNTPEALNLLERGRCDDRPFNVLIAAIDGSIPGAIAFARSVREEKEGASPINVLPLVQAGDSPGLKAVLEAGFPHHATMPVKRSELFHLLSQLASDADPIDSINIHADNLQPIHEGAVPASSSDEQRPRILVTEDDEVNQWVILNLLENFGYNVDLARNGREVLDRVESTEYDAILMDCKLPEMSGYQATVEIRSRDDSKRRTPIIALTAQAMAGDREKAFASGMDDYLTKPVLPETLRAVLEKWAPIPQAHSPAPKEAVKEDKTENEDLDPGVLQRWIDMDGESGGSFAAELVSLFISRTEGDIQSLDLACRSHDAAAVRELAHRMISRALNIGARPLASILTELECSSAAGNLEQGPALVQAIRNRFNRLQALLSSRNAQSGPLESRRQ